MRSPIFVDEQCGVPRAEGHLRVFRAPAPATTPRCCSREQEFLEAARAVALERLSARARHGGRAGGGRAASARCRALSATARQRLIALGLVGLRPLSGARLARRAEFWQRRARRARAPAAGDRPASAQAGHGHSRALRPDVLGPDAHREGGAQPADFPTTRNYLKITMCNIHDELVQRSELPALAALLAGRDAAAAQQPGLAG